MILEARDQTCADVARRAYFQRHPALAEHRHQFGVLPGCQPVADPLGTQQLDGCADTFRACSFARVSGDVQTRITGFPENIREELRRAAHLVAADPKRDDAVIAVALRPPEHGAYVVHSELADGIKDPVHPNTSSRLGITRGAGN